MDLQEQGAIAAAQNQGWAVVRLVTIQKKKEMSRLLFATVSELAQDRPAPSGTRDIEQFALKDNDERLFFRRVVLAKEDAVRWYLSLGEGDRPTPVPARDEDRHEYDGLPMRVPHLEDGQPWPALGLPIREEFFTPTGSASSDPVPFVGSASARLHRRFGDRAGFASFLRHEGAQAFVARRMHVKLVDYQEYLGSIAYIAPDPVIQSIDSFMVPPEDGRGERIVYRFVPRPGQSLEGVRITAFDKEARLLTRFETRPVPPDGILDVDKGTCMGQYGFVVTHEQHGVLAYQPFVSFLRQMNVSMHAVSGARRRVRVPFGDAEDAPMMEYEAATGSSLASTSVIGEGRAPGVNVRVEQEARMRERRAEAKRLGQRWFPKGSRQEAATFVQELLRGARRKVVIADPYLSSLQLGQFLYVLHGIEVEVTLLTTNRAFKPTRPRTKLEMLEAFQRNLDELNARQKIAPNVRVLAAASVHDRFLVVDDAVWLIGNSLNSLGGKASMVVRLPNPDEVIDKLDSLAAEAPDLKAYIAQVSKDAVRGAQK